MKGIRLGPPPGRDGTRKTTTQVIPNKKYPERKDQIAAEMADLEERCVLCNYKGNGILDFMKCDIFNGDICKPCHHNIYERNEDGVDMINTYSKYTLPGDEIRLDEICEECMKK